MFHFLETVNKHRRVKVIFFFTLVDCCHKDLQTVTYAKQVRAVLLFDCLLSRLILLVVVVQTASIGGICQRLCGSCR